MDSEKGQIDYLSTRHRRLRSLVLAILCAVALTLLSPRVNYPTIRNVHSADVASKWEDNIWPYREQTAWDISTDFPYPRTLEYDVEEGTWLRLDVHPITGEIVFDMLGDLYCLASSEPAAKRATAYAILVGVPYDSDPHFSPEGDRLVFRSDAELGVENIWVMPWKGCKNMNVRRPGHEQRWSLASRVKEARFTRRNRLNAEGRLQARRVTNETFRWLSDARFHPSGTKIIASKWYTTYVTLAASEGWEFDVPSLTSEEAVIRPQSGHRLLGRTLPPGKTLKDYSNQQIGPAQFSWRTEDTLIYSKNVKDDFTIGDEHDVHQGVYAIFSHNMTTGTDTLLVNAYPGGASRPELSRDKRTLAFVRRVRDHEVLAFFDLETGTLHYIFDGLTYDLSLSWAPMGTYPSFAFTPSDDAVIIWAAGQIYNIPLTTNAAGERVRNGEPTRIRFKAHIELQLADTLKGGIDLVGLETKDEMSVHAFSDLDIDQTGKWAVMQAAGVSVVQDVETGTIIKVPVLDSKAPYYSPSFVGGSGNMIIHARWSDTNFSSIEIADLKSGTVTPVAGLPFGRYQHPVVSSGPGPSRKIAFIKTKGDVLTGDVVATANPGIYLGDVVLPQSKGDHTEITSLHFIADFAPGPVDNIYLKFSDDASQLIVQGAKRAYTLDVGRDPDLFDVYAQHTMASGRMSTEIAATSSNVAFVEFQHLFLAPINTLKDGDDLWAKPGNATKGLARLSTYNAHHVVWSRDGKKLFWLSGAELHSLEVSRLTACASPIEDDAVNFGVKCVQGLVERQKIRVSHSTDIARLKRDALSSNQTGVLVIRNGTILTMETGTPEQDLLKEAVMVLKDGVIQTVGSARDIDIPVDAKIIDAHGGYVIPGFIDMHAHWGGPLAGYPAKSWEMQTFLAYGITTMHNPSSPTVFTFIERSRLESGQFVGPRILTSGSPLFGGGWVGLHEEIVDMDEAKAALMRIKAEAGPIALSYKNYQLPSRASRQRLLKTAREVGLLCVPEGGGYYDWDLTYIIDGMTTVEHAIPPSVHYDDVMTLFVESGTGSTPTHVVSYGGPFGEEYVWAHDDVPNDPKLRRFSRHDKLEGLHETYARPNQSYVMFNTSQTVAKMVRKGLKAHIGAHGEPPMGHNYHAEMMFTKVGGLTNYEVLQAATSSSAQTLGLWGSIGSLAPGKLADFLVYSPGVDLLQGPLTDSRRISLVARGGRAWDAETMAEIWPLQKEPQDMPPFNIM